MNCSFDKEKLSGYYDGELSAAERGEVERHIASCSECLRDLGELKSAALLVKDLPHLRAPKSIAEGVSREIQSAGKLHSMARVRRMVLWATAAAAGLFVVMNVLVLSRQGAPTANEPTVALAPAKLAEARRGNDEQKAADRATAPEPARRELEVRKNLGEAGEKRAAEVVVEESKKLDQARDKVGAAAAPAAKPTEALAKADAPPPPAAAPPAPVAPGRAAPSTPLPAPAPAPEALRAETAPSVEKEKPAAAKEAEVARKAEADKSKSTVAAAPVAPPELPPAQFNVVARELAKARPRLEDSLKKMGLEMPAPPPQPTRQPRSRDAENTIVLELTDAQLARLQADLEKPGDARLVPAPKLGPLPAFSGNGLFGKKDGGAAAGGKAAAATKEKDAKETKDADDAAAAAAGPRRKVTLHLIESKNLPPVEGDPVPPQK